MVKLFVSLFDYDDEQRYEFYLPTDLQLDKTHEYLIEYHDGLFTLGDFDDVFKLNKVLDYINSENPDMTNELLGAIFDASCALRMSDAEFLRKICEKDFMMDEVECVLDNVVSDEATAASYLAVRCRVPYAHNITQKRIDDISAVNDFDWDLVWPHYEHMGFKILWVGLQMYVFNWNDAEQTQPSYR